MVRIVIATFMFAWMVVGVGLTQPAAASKRSRTERITTAPALALVPAAAAPPGSSAQILSGLDFSAIAPLGERLRVIEDEPYIFALADNSAPKPSLLEAASALSLVSNREDGGTYEARLSVRIALAPPQQQTLLDSFDSAAHSDYRASLITDELREGTTYSLHEVRSPLGLTHPLDKASRHREYLAYTAALVNPIGIGIDGLPATPYRSVNGRLKYIRLLRDGLALVTVEFTAHEYPHSLTLTENLARAVANRLDPKMSIGERLEYMAYQPEFEPARPFFVGEPIDPRTADLAEQPGEGCGHEALPANGSLCPACIDGLLHSPATPHAATLLDVIGPPAYMPGGSQVIDAGAPFPTNAKCYRKFVLRYDLARKLAKRESRRTPQRCQAAGDALCGCNLAKASGAATASLPPTADQPTEELQLDSAPTGHGLEHTPGLPPELLARLKLASQSVDFVGTGAADKSTTSDPLADGVTATSTSNAS